MKGSPTGFLHVYNAVDILNSGILNLKGSWCGRPHLLLLFLGLSFIDTGIEPKLNET